MSFKDDFNLFVGADYGIFKGAKAYQGQVLVKGIQSLKHLSNETNITAMSWDNDDEEEILLGLSNQVVKTYDTKGKSFIFSKDARVLSEDGKVLSSGSLCGVSRFDGVLVTASESGHVRVSRYKEEECINIDAGKDLCKMRHSKVDSNIIGTGGLENELKLWDLITGKKTFEAKNVPNDQRLQLRVKVWVSDHVFLPGSQKVAVGSRYGYVRLYDPKAQRRPVMKLDLPEQAISCIAATNREDTVLCGLAKGNIVTIDLRNQKPGQLYKGFYGAVRDIVCHPTEPYIASVSKDRFLRVHHLTSKKLLLKEFLVTRSNCILMRSNFTLDPVLVKEDRKAEKRIANDTLRSDGESDSENQLDEMFNAMQEVTDEPVRKSRKLASRAGTDSPSKKNTAQLVVNPFASKATETKSPKKKVAEPVKKSNDDSDDDIMIVSESISNGFAPVQEQSESEPDEADGESDELDEGINYDDDDDEDEEDEEEEEDDSDDDGAEDDEDSDED